MTGLSRRAIGRLKREATPLITAARGTPQAKEVRRALERSRMRLRTRQSSPDDVLDGIVAEAHGIVAEADGIVAEDESE